MLMHDAQVIWRNATPGESMLSIVQEKLCVPFNVQDARSATNRVFSVAPDIYEWPIVNGILSFVGGRVLQVRTLATAHPTAACTRVLPTQHWKCLHAMIYPEQRIP